MTAPRFATIQEYIAAAPPTGQSHARELYKLLKSVAPKAEETIKWNTPFFIEPRFLFAFSAHKKHLSLAPSPETLEVFRDELAGHVITKGTLHLPYNKPLPIELIRKIAEYRVKVVGEREDDGFW